MNAFIQPGIQNFKPINDDKETKPKIFKYKLLDMASDLSSGDVASISNNLENLAVIDLSVLVTMLVALIVFLSVWILGLVKMKKSCTADQTVSPYWIITLVLGLIPSGLTQLAAFVMACYGISKPEIGCQ